VYALYYNVVLVYYKEDLQVTNLGLEIGDDKPVDPTPNSIDHFHVLSIAPFAK
jgi:hypothetical protein